MAMSIRTSKNSKGHVLSYRSPVRTLLQSEFQSAIKWLVRKRDINGNRIGKIEIAESVVKYDKDTFSLYSKTASGKSVSINDVRGKAIFLRVLPSGRMDTADIFLFCLGAGKYILTEWLTVWRVMQKLYRDRGTVIYKDAWRLDRKMFIELLQKEISGKI